MAVFNINIISRVAFFHNNCNIGLRHHIGSTIALFWKDSNLNHATTVDRQHDIIISSLEVKTWISLKPLLAQINRRFPHLLLELWTWSDEADDRVSMLLEFFLLNYLFLGSNCRHVSLMFFCALVPSKTLHFVNEAAQIMLMLVSTFYFAQDACRPFVSDLISGFLAFLCLCCHFSLEHWACHCLIVLSRSIMPHWWVLFVWWYRFIWRTLMLTAYVAIVLTKVVKVLDLIVSMDMVFVFFDVLLHRIANEVDNFELLFMGFWNQDIFTIFLDSLEELKMLVSAFRVSLLLKFVHQVNMCHLGISNTICSWVAQIRNALGGGQGIWVTLMILQFEILMNFS